MSFKARMAALKKGGKKFGSKVGGKLKAGKQKLKGMKFGPSPGQRAARKGIAKLTRGKIYGKYAKKK